MGFVDLMVEELIAFFWLLIRIFISMVTGILQAIAIRKEREDEWNGEEVEQ